MSKTNANIITTVRSHDVSFKHKKLKGDLFDYSTKSPMVRLAVTRLFQQKKFKHEVIDDFTVRKNIINEGDLLLAMFEINDEAKKKCINIRKA